MEPDSTRPRRRVRLARAAARSRPDGPRACRKPRRVARPGGRRCPRRHADRRQRPRPVGADHRGERCEHPAVLTDLRDDLDRVLRALDDPDGQGSPRDDRRDHRRRQPRGRAAPRQARYDQALRPGGRPRRRHPGQIAALLQFIGEIGINLEDMRLEHSPGAPIGIVEVSVVPRQEQRLVEELEGRGWRIAAAWDDTTTRTSPWTSPASPGDPRAPTRPAHPDAAGRRSGRWSRRRRARRGGRRPGEPRRRAGFDQRSGPVRSAAGRLRGEDRHRGRRTRGQRQVERLARRGPCAGLRVPGTGAAYRAWRGTHCSRASTSTTRGRRGELGHLRLRDRHRPRRVLRARRRHRRDRRDPHAGGHRSSVAHIAKLPEVREKLVQLFRQVMRKADAQGIITRGATSPRSSHPMPRSASC